MMMHRTFGRIVCAAIIACSHFAAGDDDESDGFSMVTCGSVVKLLHTSTRFRLHSHDIKWGTGSSQQSVTTVSAMDDPNSYWIIKGAHGQHCPQGTPVKNGQTIRLTHLQTKRNLHSHRVESPLSKQQEISAFGDGGNGDHLDNWIIQNIDGDAVIKRGKKFQLKHAETGAYLHSHSSYRFDSSNCGGTCPIMGQQEVTGFPSDDANNHWRTSEGIYFPAISPDGASVA